MTQQLQPLKRRNLRTVYPCCGGPARIVALADVPRQTCDRVCPRCGRLWIVERTDLGALRIGHADQLAWIHARRAFGGIMPLPEKK